MALIYANAVNKRINNPTSKPKKKHTPPCTFLNGNCSGTTTECRSRSASREVGASRKTSCNIPLHSQVNHYHGASEALASTQPPHRPVHRSKTSCGELSHMDEDETPRKLSHPAMRHSATSQTPSRRRADEKRALAKKSLIQKYNLEHGYDERLPNSVGRRRSVSLDADQWFDQITGSTDRQKKDGAFQKMKRKFSKWKLSGRLE